MDLKSRIMGREFSRRIFNSFAKGEPQVKLVSTHIFLASNLLDFVEKLFQVFATLVLCRFKQSKKILRLGGV
jgi:hypothetical protein